MGLAGLTPKYGWTCAPEALRKNTFLCLIQALEATYIPWFTVPSKFKLSEAGVCILSSTNSPPPPRSILTTSFTIQRLIDRRP